MLLLIQIKLLVRSRSDWFQHNDAFDTSHRDKIPIDLRRSKDFNKGIINFHQDREPVKT
jgi:hypothetical protein